MALSTGADDYAVKPLVPKQLLERLENGLLRMGTSLVSRSPIPRRAQLPPRPRLPSRQRSSTTRFKLGLAVAASTGGPDALAKFFSRLGTISGPIFLVLHGPVWMLKTYSERLAKVARREVVYVERAMAYQANTIYLAPGDKHIRIRSNQVEPFDAPLINYVKPAADPLFESFAEIFKQRGLGVVLTGMGRDAAAGSQALAEAGGHVFAKI